MAKRETSIAESLSRAHQALRNDLRKLEECIDSLLGQNLPLVRAHLGTTRTHLLDHFRFEEKNGYMDKVRKDVPRLEREIKRLAEEHRELAQALDALIGKAKELTNLDHPFRDEIRQWIVTVGRHETREDELVQDAFNLDIGAED
jgi:hypothetical protein